MVVLTSFMYPSSPIHFEERNTRAILDKNDLGIGTLYVSERNVCWKKGDIEYGFSLSYHHISLHATSSDPNVYPKECIYIMIDTHVTVPGDNEQTETDSISDSDISEPDISELILAPEDSGSLHPMYEALKECQALNPDPDDVISDEDDVYEDADEDIDDGRTMQQEISDNRGGGDTVMDNLTVRMQNNSVNVVYDYINGDQNDEEFEDAD